MADDMWEGDEDLLKTLDSLNKNLEVAAGTDVLVGIPQTMKGKKTSPFIITKATVHEYGSPLKNIPARSFIFGPINKNRDVFVKKLIRLLEPLVMSDGAAISTAYNNVGETMASFIRENVRDDNITPPAKRKSGSGPNASAPTLVGTADDGEHMIEAVDYYVNQTKKE